MSAAYLVRFDDICATMNWAVWDQVERLLIELRVKPILAIVPDNRDADLECGPASSDFWSRVRDWQARGWTIGLHGYQHRYVTRDAGVLGLNGRSEFAGLPLDEQLRKLSAGIEIFRREGVEPDLWVAPGHSFDDNTMEALRRIGLRCVSDGFLLYPGRDVSETFWLPQQLWRFRRLPFGVWTVCHHHNAWTRRDVERLRRDLVDYSAHMTDFDRVKAQYWARRSTALDRAFGAALLLAHRARRVVA
jgi:predicted deacetylase